MAWRVARSLLVLRDQVDQMYPGRGKASDGTIGDVAHQAGASDHNPDRAGVVRAMDLTNDPANGCDIDSLSDTLAATRDTRIKYVIANSLIMSGAAGPAPWVWRAYRGSDPHTGHLHLSVVADDRADDPRPWQIVSGVQTPGRSIVAGFVRWIGAPEVFFTDGTIARHIGTEAEVPDIRTLSAEGIYPPLGNGGNVRVVGRRTLIPPIIGDIPAGWEDWAAHPAGVITMTESLTASIAVAAAEIVGTRIADLREQLADRDSRLAAAYAADPA